MAILDISEIIYCKTPTLTQLNQNQQQQQSAMDILNGVLVKIDKS